MTWTKRAWPLAGLLLVANLVPLLGAGQDKAPAGKQEASAPPRGQRVFYASHSLMWYVPAPLGELAEAAKIKDHKLVDLQKLGASKTLQHWNLPEEKNKAKDKKNKDKTKSAAKNFKGTVTKTGKKSLTVKGKRKADRKDRTVKFVVSSKTKFMRGDKAGADVGRGAKCRSALGTADRSRAGVATSNAPAHPRAGAAGAVIHGHAGAVHAVALDCAADGQRPRARRIGMADVRIRRIDAGRGENSGSNTRVQRSAATGHGAPPKWDARAEAHESRSQRRYAAPR